jgi:ketosteroid isomerase-like protein
MKWMMMGAVALAFAAPAISQGVGPQTGRDSLQQAASRQVSAALRQPAATVDTFHAALGRGDTAAASALLASDASIFESGRAERSKAEYAAHHLAADAAFARSTRREVTRRHGRIAGDLAWIATETRTTGTYKRGPINSTGTETMLLRRERAGWRIVHIHWSSADVK